jgi:hypothetical protein
LRHAGATRQIGREFGGASEWRANAGEANAPLREVAISDDFGLAQRARAREL